MNITTVRDATAKLTRMRAAAATVRTHAKSITHEVVGTALALATAGGIGVWDEAKGVSDPNDVAGIRTAKLGPLPASLVVAAAGKVGAVALIGDETGRLASAIGQGAADAWSYVQARRMWAKHAKNAK